MDQPPIGFYRVRIQTPALDFKKLDASTDIFIRLLKITKNEST